ncbi:hypothetical protein Bbelb_408680 [Branchiostoma belcheri]|nr:hypothetical protein Bbelb_408680 [Branchiostoma belcheri]
MLQERHLSLIIGQKPVSHLPFSYPHPSPFRSQSIHALLVRIAELAPEARLQNSKRRNPQPLGMLPWEYEAQSHAWESQALRYRAERMVLSEKLKTIMPCSDPKARTILEVFLESPRVKIARQAAVRALKSIFGRSTAGVLSILARC